MMYCRNLDQIYINIFFGAVASFYLITFLKKIYQFFEQPYVYTCLRLQVCVYARDESKSMNNFMTMTNAIEYDECNNYYLSMLNCKN